MAELTVFLLVETVYLVSSTIAANITILVLTGGYAVMTANMTMIPGTASFWLPGLVFANAYYVDTGEPVGMSFDGKYLTIYNDRQRGDIVVDAVFLLQRLDEHMWRLQASLPGFTVNVLLPKNVVIFNISGFLAGIKPPEISGGDYYVLHFSPSGGTPSYPYPVNITVDFAIMREHPTSEPVVIGETGVATSTPVAVPTTPPTVTVTGKPTVVATLPKTTSPGECPVGECPETLPNTDNTLLLVVAGIVAAAAVGGALLYKRRKEAGVV